jgi:hypothetical protein
VPGPQTPTNIGIGEVVSFKLPAKLGGTVTFGAQIVGTGQLQTALIKEADYQNFLNGNNVQSYSGCARAASSRPHALVLRFNVPRLVRRFSDWGKWGCWFSGTFLLPIGVDTRIVLVCADYPLNLPCSVKYAMSGAASVKASAVFAALCAIFAVKRGLDA